MNKEKMKKLREKLKLSKFAFTLIELLAVIIVIALLLTIIAPKVKKTLNDAEKNTNMTSAQNLVKASEFRYSNDNITGNTKNIILTYPQDKDSNILDYSGASPEAGRIKIKPNGKIAMAVKFGDLCYTKSYTSNDINVIPYDESTCNENSEVFEGYDIQDLVTSGDGLYQAKGEQGRYVFRGANPNNYIKLTENGVDEIYRIVSYEPDGTIKVVRNEVVNETWDTSGGRTPTSENTFCYVGPSGCAAWGNQNDTLFKGEPLGDTFHYEYYENNYTTELTSGLAVGRTLTTSSTLNIYLNGEWLENSGLSQYIESHDFNVGPVNYKSTSDGDKGLLREKEEESLYTWNGKVGLLTVTEYAESSTNPTCTSVYSDWSVDSDSATFVSPCSVDNYNLSPDVFASNPNTAIATITPKDAYAMNPSDIWQVYPNHGFGYERASFIFLSLPAFYLKATTNLGGTGTSSDPYYIK